MKSTARKKLGRGGSQEGEGKRWRRSEMEKVRRERNSDVEKVRREKIRDGESQKREKLGRGESQKREDAGARKGREGAKHCVFPLFCGSGGSKSRLAKAVGEEPADQMRNEKLHAVVAGSTF